MKALSDMAGLQRIDRRQTVDTCKVRAVVTKREYFSQATSTKGNPHAPPANNICRSCPRLSYDVYLRSDHGLSHRGWGRWWPDDADAGSVDD